GFEVGKEDGIFGARTSDAVAEFQLNVGEPPDGIVGPGTLAALERLRPAVAGPSRAVVREAEDVSRLERSLAGSRSAEPNPPSSAVGTSAPRPAIALSRPTRSARTCACPSTSTRATRAPRAPRASTTGPRPPTRPPAGCSPS